MPHASPRLLLITHVWVAPGHTFPSFHTFVQVAAAYLDHLATLDMSDPDVLFGADGTSGVVRQLGPGIVPPSAVGGIGTEPEFLEGSDLYDVSMKIHYNAKRVRLLYMRI